MSNKEIVLNFYEKVFNNWDLSDLETVMREDYMQHSPEVEDGREGFVKFMNEFLKNNGLKILYLNSRPFSSIVSPLKYPGLIPK